METGKILVGDEMQAVKIKKEGNQITIGENPQLIVNLLSQDNYIKLNQQMIPYRKKIMLSRDLLAGKRENVLNTAVNHYYRQACAVADGIVAAKEYREKMNTTVREVR